MNKTDRLTFWRGWYDGARRYPDEQRLAVYDAILAFAFDGREPEEPDGDLTAAIVYQTIATIRPTIEISRKRREFGAAGGRSKGEAAAEHTPSTGGAKRKQNASKAKAKRKQNGKTPNQVKEQVQEQEHIAICSTTLRTRPSLLQFVQGGELAGVPADFARQLYKDLTDAGWGDSEGRDVGNWRRYLKSAWNTEQKKIRAARESSAGDGLDAFKIGR